MCIINPLCFSPQVKNKTYKPTGKYAFILEKGAVVNKHEHRLGSCQLLIEWISKVGSWTSAIENPLTVSIPLIG
jgi:hypothetical protein